VQLPFPSTLDLHPAPRQYHRRYSAAYAAAFADDTVPASAVGDPVVGRAPGGHTRNDRCGAGWLDLSTVEAALDPCLEAVLDATGAGDLVYLSRLAQNLDLAKALSHRLLERGRSTVLGGNMSPMASADEGRRSVSAI
jgi:hypothetical protein